MFAAYNTWAHEERRIDVRDFNDREGGGPYHDAVARQLLIAPATPRGIPDALELAASGRVAPGKVVSHVVDWEDLPAALPEKRLKPVFVRADVWRTVTVGAMK